MSRLWYQDTERDFIRKILNKVSPDDFFYRTDDDRRFAFRPKNFTGRIKKNDTVQSRNIHIGSYSEEWIAELLNPIADAVNCYSVRGVKCKELELTTFSPADVAICKTPDVVQVPQNILMIFEVKMSLNWNWEFKYTASKESPLVCIGDYKSHTGSPSILRSDSMLKALGKGAIIKAAIRESSIADKRIPFLVIGNTPLATSYYTKVDKVRNDGTIHGVWSINPEPLDNEADAKHIKASPGKAFYTFDSYEEFKAAALNMLTD